MVDDLLKFRKLAEAAASQAFVDPSTYIAIDADPKAIKTLNNEFGYAIVDAFTAGFKHRRKKPAEMIAHYMDRALRKGAKEASAATFESLLGDVLGLYRFTDDKDVFRKFYHRALAKRLLHGRSADTDGEKFVIQKLKEGKAIRISSCVR